MTKGSMLCPSRLPRHGKSEVIRFVKGHNDQGERSAGGARVATTKNGQVAPQQA